jgi:hypothetical protein
MEALTIWLAHEDCRLEGLRLWFPPPSERFVPFGGGFVNRSLQRLELLDGNIIKSQDLGSLFNDFPELRELSLRGNKICDLRPLESVLCHVDCKIQELDVAKNLINDDAFSKFTSKLPLMKSLRCLFAEENTFTDALRYTWLHNVLNCRGLECLSLRAPANHVGIGKLFDLPIVVASDPSSRTIDQILCSFVGEKKRRTYGRQPKGTRRFLSSQRSCLHL